MEENNNALPTEEPKTGKKRNYKSATQRISEMKIATANAQHPPVADALKTVGYTDESLAALQAEVAQVENLDLNQQKEYAGIKKWGDYSPAGTYGIKGNGMYHGYGTGHGSQKQPGKSYQELADALGEGMIVKHKKFGEGVVVDMEGEHIRIQFGDNVKNMDLKVLARLGMLEI